MKHKHSVLAFWYHDKCPVCKVRQLRYGFRFDPEGKERAITAVIKSKIFTRLEKTWILAQIHYVG